MEHVREGTLLARILDWCRGEEATDLHCQADKPYSIRVHGKLSWVPIELFPPPSNEEIYGHLRESFSTGACARIESQLEVDLSFYSEGRRYRANFSKQKGQQSFSFRTVPQQRLKLKDLQLPDSLKELVREPRGLILLTGP